MPQFLVLTLEGDTIPPTGGIGSAFAYRGDHADEDDAVIAAAEALGAPSGKRLWAVPAAADSIREHDHRYANGRGEVRGREDGHISDTVANSFLNAFARNTSYANAAVDVQLHTGDPGSAGTMAVAGEPTASRPPSARWLHQGRSRTRPTSNGRMFSNTERYTCDFALDRLDLGDLPGS